MFPDRGLERWLAWRQVRDVTGLGRTTAWRMRQEGDFPDPVSISPGRVAWRERDIIDWTATRGQALATPRARPLTKPSAPSHSQRPARTRPALISPPVTPPVLPTEAGGLKTPETAKRRRRAHKVADGQLGFDF